MAPTGAVPWTSERSRRRRRSWRRAILKGGGRSDGRRPARHGLAPRRRSLPHRAGCTSRCARGGCGGGGHAQRERRFWKRLRLPGRQLWRRRSRQPFRHEAAMLAGSVTAGGGRRAGDFVAAATPQGAALLVASAFAGRSRRRRLRRQRQKKSGRPGGSHALHSCPGWPWRRQRCPEGAASLEKSWSLR